MANLLKFRKNLKTLPKFPKLIRANQRSWSPQRVVKRAGAYYDKVMELADQVTERKIELPYISDLPNGGCHRTGTFYLYPRTAGEELAAQKLKSIQETYGLATLSAIYKLEEIEGGANANERFRRSSRGLVATIHMDKKYQDTELNSETAFNDLGFHKVEVDTEKYQGQEFDLAAFRGLEEEYKSIYSKLPKPSSAPELKIRKLGKHKAIGLYSPDDNILAIDVRDTSAFTHEYGHLLDFQNGQDTPYSEGVDFEAILDRYNRELPQNTIKRDYYTTPTEVFARAYEIYAVEKGWTTQNTCHTQLQYQLEEYKPLQGMKSDIVAYMDSIFN